MPAKKHKPEEIIGKLREVEIMLGQGGTTAEACRRITVSEQTYYWWRKEHGGLKIAKVADDWPATRWDELIPWDWMPPVDQPTAQAA